MKLLVISLTLLLFELITASAHAIPRIETSSTEVYEVQDNSNSTIRLINPKPEKPVVREIFYYHIIEKPYGNSENQEDKVINDEGPEFDETRHFTNAHSYPFLEEENIPEKNKEFVEPDSEQDNDADKEPSDVHEDMESIELDKIIEMIIEADESKVDEEMQVEETEELGIGDTEDGDEEVIYYYEMPEDVQESEGLPDTPEADDPVAKYTDIVDEIPEVKMPIPEVLPEDAQYEDSNIAEKPEDKDNLDETAIEYENKEMPEDVQESEGLPDTPEVMADDPGADDTDIVDEIPEVKEPIPEEDTAGDSKIDESNIDETNKARNLLFEKEKEKYQRTRKPAVELNSSTRSFRRKRQAMIPEAPRLPELNYDILPDNIRKLISTETPPTNPALESQETLEKYNDGNYEQMKDNIEEMLTNSKPSESEEEDESFNKNSRTYGISLAGDQGYVFNNLWSDPGTSYDVGSTDGIKGDKDDGEPEPLNSNSNEDFSELTPIDSKPDSEEHLSENSDENYDIFVNIDGGMYKPDKDLPKDKPDEDKSDDNSDLDKNEEYSGKNNPFHDEKLKEEIEDKIEEIVDNWKPEEPDSQNKSPKTYGMNLEGDHGYVWNDLWSNPGISYDVGNIDKIEGIKDEPNKELPMDIPDQDKTDDNTDLIENKEESKDILDEPKPDENKYPDENPSDDKLNISENSEEVTDQKDIVDDILDQRDGNKSDQENDLADKEGPKDESQGTNDKKEQTEIEENPKEDDKNVEKQKPDTFEELMKKEQFWKWLAGWTSTYMEVLTKHVKKIVKEEVNNQMKAYLESHKDNNSKNNIEEIHLESKKEEVIEIQKEDSIEEPVIENDTLIIDDREIPITHNTNFDQDDLLKRRKDKDPNKRPNLPIPSPNITELPITTINDTKLSIPTNNTKVEENSDKLRPIRINAQTIYGNSAGNDKVTNIFIFYSNKNSEKVIEELKPTNDSANNIFIFGQDNATKENENPPKLDDNKESNGGDSNKQTSPDKDQDKKPSLDEGQEDNKGGNSGNNEISKEPVEKENLLLGENKEPMKEGGESIREEIKEQTQEENTPENNEVAKEIEKVEHKEETKEEDKVENKVVSKEEEKVENKEEDTIENIDENKDEAKDKVEVNHIEQIKEETVEENEEIKEETVENSEETKEEEKVDHEDHTKEQDKVKHEEAPEEKIENKEKEGIENNVESKEKETVENKEEEIVDNNDKNKDEIKDEKIIDHIEETKEDETVEHNEEINIEKVENNDETEDNAKEEDKVDHEEESKEEEKVVNKEANTPDAEES